MLALLSAAFIAMGVIGWFIDRLLTARQVRRVHAQWQALARQRDTRMLVEQDRANAWIESHKRADAARRWC
jgi:hypothetical protein